MARGHSVLIWATICVGAVTGCNSAVNLRPREIASDRGAIFGHILVLNEGQLITHECKVGFSQEGKANLSLDWTGWVFTTVPAGPAHLYTVLCGPEKDYRTQRLAFQVPGNGRITYFGDIRIDMYHQEPDMGEAMLMGLAGMSPRDWAKAPRSAKPRPLQWNPDNPDPFGAMVTDDFEAAVREYQKRFGDDAMLLKPVTSIAGSAGDHVGVLASAAPPTAAFGFPLGQDPAAAEAVCTRASLAWQKLDGGGFSCNGVAIDIDVPVTVKLTACAGMVCEASVDANPDGAPWSTLLERFNKIVRRLTRSTATSTDTQRALCLAAPRPPSSARPPARW